MRKVRTTRERSTDRWQCELATADIPLLGRSPQVRFRWRGTYRTILLIEGPLGACVLHAQDFRDQWAGPGLVAEHQMLSALRTRYAPRALYMDVSRTRLAQGFRIESYCPGEHPQAFSPELMSSLAVALASVHGQPLPVGASNGAGDHSWRQVVTWLERQIDDYPSLRPLIKRCLHFVRRNGPASPPPPRLAITHNDLHLENMQIGDDGLTLVDWEHASVADPAQDIAALFWFEVLLRGDQPLPDDLRAQFLDEYVSVTGDSSVGDRVRLHEPLVVLTHLMSWCSQRAALPTLPPHLQERMAEVEERLEAGQQHLLSCC
jgi:Ser/Thr protein kinase RdoA (MazF antagonist)